MLIEQLFPQETHIHILGANIGAFLSPLSEMYSSEVTRLLPNIVNISRTYFASKSHVYSRGLPMIDPIDATLCPNMYLICLLIFAIIGKIIGKKEMWLPSILYNIFMLIFSLYVFIVIGYIAWADNFSVWNNPVSASSTYGLPMAYMHWVFLVFKIFEFCDSFILLLRGERLLISHIYRRTSVVMVTWVWVVLAPGGDGYFGAMTDSGMHAVIHSYHLLRLLGPPSFSSYLHNRFLFVTTYGHLMQLLLNFSHFVYLLFIVSKPEVPILVMNITFWYILTSLAVHTNFLVKYEVPKMSRIIHPSKLSPSVNKNKMKKMD